MKEISIQSESDTARLAKLLAPHLCGGMIVGVSGDLGAGKTTFARYLVVALGGSSLDVTSPSYTLQNEYSIAGGLGLEHWDLYRVRDLPEELLEPPSRNSIRLIEWPERCPVLISEIDLMLSFTVLDSGERSVVVGGREASRISSAMEGKLRKLYGD